MRISNQSGKSRLASNNNVSDIINSKNSGPSAILSNLTLTINECSPTLQQENKRTPFLMFNHVFPISFGLKCLKLKFFHIHTTSACQGPCDSSSGTHPPHRGHRCTTCPCPSRATQAGDPPGPTTAGRKPSHPTPPDSEMERRRWGCSKPENMIRIDRDDESMRLHPR